VDSLRQAVGGGVDPKTRDLVLLNEKGDVIQRLVPRSDIPFEQAVTTA
jgi:hypothetical protein